MYTKHRLFWGRGRGWYRKPKRPRRLNFVVSRIPSTLTVTRTLLKLYRVVLLSPPPPEKPNPKSLGATVFLSSSLLLLVACLSLCAPSGSCLKELVNSGEAFDACFVIILLSSWSFARSSYSSSTILLPGSRQSNTKIHDAAMRNRRTVQLAPCALNYWSCQ